MAAECWNVHRVYGKSWKMLVSPTFLLIGCGFFLGFMGRVGRCWSLTRSSPTSHFFGSLTWNPDSCPSLTRSGISRASQDLSACSSPEYMLKAFQFGKLWWMLTVLMWICRKYNVGLIILLFINVVTSSVMLSKLDVTQAGSGPSYG